MKKLQKEMGSMKRTLSDCLQKCYQLIKNVRYIIKKIFLFQGNDLSSFASKSETLRRDYAE
jgi:hypothetical protein